MRKTTLIPLGLGALALAACQPVAPSATTQPPATVTTTATSAPATTSAAPTSASTTSASVTTSSAAPTQSGSAGSTPVCSQERLNLAVAKDPSGTGAGHAGFTLTVVNASSDPCRLPMASKIYLVDDSPQAVNFIGAPARFEPANADVVIPAGKAAKTTLSIAQAQNQAGCKPKQAARLAVQLPTGPGQVSQKGSIEVMGCDNADIVLIEAKPFTLA